MSRIKKSYFIKTNFLDMLSHFGRNSTLEPRLRRLFHKKSHFSLEMSLAVSWRYTPETNDTPLYFDLNVSDLYWIPLKLLKKNSTCRMMWGHYPWFSANYQPLWLALAIIGIHDCMKYYTTKDSSGYTLFLSVHFLTAILRKQKSNDYWWKVETCFFLL